MYTVLITLAGIEAPIQLGFKTEAKAKAAADKIGEGEAVSDDFETSLRVHSGLLATRVLDPETVSELGVQLALVNARAQADANAKWSSDPKQRLTALVGGTLGRS